MWAIRSQSLISSERCEQILDRSPKMSNHERFAHIAQRKRPIVSESLRSLTKNERMSKSLIFLSESLNCSFFEQKRAIGSEIKWANVQPWKRERFCIWIKNVKQWLLSFFFYIKNLRYYFIVEAVWGGVHYWANECQAPPDREEQTEDPVRAR